MFKSATKCIGKVLRRKSRRRVTSSAFSEREVSASLELIGQLGFTPLHVAAANGRKEKVESLLEGSADVDVDARTRDLYTPLHLAAMNYPKEVAELLVNHGADINARAIDLRTPLHIAVEEERYEVAKFLVVNGADVNAACKDSLTPLHLAARICDEYLAELLLKAGASVNAQAERLVSPLHFAVYNGSIEMSLLQKEEPPVMRKVRVAKLLLSHGANVNARTEKSETPLHIAIKGNCLEIIPILLKYGATIDCVDGRGRTPLCLAVEMGSPTTLSSILKYRPDVECENNQNALRIALRRDSENEDMIKKLLHYGIPVRPEDATNRAIVSCVIRNGFRKTASEIFKHATATPLDFDLTPLHVAAIYRQTGVARALLKNGADVDAKDFAGRSPIFFATANADYNMFKLFVRHKATVSDPSELFHLAAKSGSLKILRTLLKVARCDVDGQDEKGRTALHNVNFSIEAVRSTSCVPHSLKAQRLSPYDIGTHAQIARFLMKSGADVNARDIFGETPLHIAVREGLDSLVEVLLEYRADLDSVDGCGHTALDKSVQFGCYNLSVLLLKKGAKANTQPHGQVTSLHVATRAGDRNHVALLLQNEVDADAVCEDGTALHIASRSSNLSIMNLLLDHDADVNAQSEQGTPLHIAASNGHKDAVKLLLFYGADLNLKNKHKLTPLECAAELACNNTLTPGVLVYLMATFKVLLEQVVRMNCVGAYVVDANLKFLTSESEFMTRFETFFNWSCRFRKLVSDCEAEIVVMRADKIADSNLTYYDIANRGSRRVIRLLSNPSIGETLSKGLYCDQYLTYSNIIKSKFEVAIRRKRFEEGSRKVFFRVYFDRLPDICIERIMDYLTDRELKLLMDLCGHCRKM